MLSKYGRGTSMKAAVESETYSSSFGELNLVEPAVVYNEEADEVRVFVLNCSQDEDTALEVELQGYGDRKLKKHLVLAGDDLEARNTIDQPDEVGMKELPVSDGAEVVLPKLSWNVLLYG